MRSSYHRLIQVTRQLNPTPSNYQGEIKFIRKIIFDRTREGGVQEIVILLQLEFEKFMNDTSEYWEKR